MKRFYFIALVAVALLAASCINRQDDGPVLTYITSTVTFRPQADGSYFLKESDDVALVVTNEDMQKYPFKDGKEKRAFVQTGVDFENPGTSRVDGFEKTYEVVLTAVDTIFTKPVIAYDKEQETTYGDDPVGVVLDEDGFPTTMIEDGYLCVRFGMPFGGLSTHSINLVSGVKPEDPYYLEFRHNDNGDDFYELVDSYVNFSLKDLPDTNGETVKLTLCWNSVVSGEHETVEFDYKSRTDW